MSNEASTLLLDLFAEVGFEDTLDFFKEEKVLGVFGLSEILRFLEIGLWVAYSSINLSLIIDRYS